MAIIKSIFSKDTAVDIFREIVVNQNSKKKSAIDNNQFEKKNYKRHLKMKKRIVECN